MITHHSSINNTHPALHFQSERNTEKKIEDVRKATKDTKNFWGFFLVGGGGGWETSFLTYLGEGPTKYRGLFPQQTNANSIGLACFRFTVPTSSLLRLKLSRESGGRQYRDPP